ncbi:MAG: CvpA family protein [Cellulosilyticaceae bacterium]
MLDLIVIGIILVSALIGAHLGFIKTIYSFVSSIIALVLAVIVSPFIEGIIKLTPLYEGIQSWVGKMMPSFETAIGVQSQAEAIKEATGFLPQFITEQMVAHNNPEIYELLGVTKLIDYITLSLSNLCVSVIALLVAWVIIKITLSVVVGILDLVAQLPLLKTANKWAGFTVGTIKGLLWVWIGCLLVPVLMIMPSMRTLDQLIQGTTVTKFLYDNNLIMQWISSILLK